MKFTEYTIFTSLLRLVSFRRGTVLLIVVLGLLSACLEGGGLYLFLPVFHSLSGEDNSKVISSLPRILRTPFEQLTSGWVIPVIIGLVLLSIVLKNLVAYANAALFAWVNCKAGHQIRTKLYSSILQASLDYVQNERSGRIPNAMLSESWRVIEAQGIVYRIIVQLCAVIVLLIVLVCISWQGTLLVIPISLAIFALMHFVSLANQRLGAEAVKANSEFIDRFWATIEGLPTIRNFGTAELENTKFAKVSSTIRDVFQHLQLVGNVSGPTFEILAVSALVVWVASLLYLGVSVANAAIFLVVVSRLQPRLRFLTESRASLMQFESSVLEIEEVEQACRNSALPDGDQTLPRIVKKIEFRDVSLRYEGRDSPAVNNVSFQVPRNSTLALVGPSGAGKTSIISLLCRHRDPTEGTINLDGINLKSVVAREWRGRLAVVPQEVHLFNSSIADNIAYGVLKYDFQQVMEAARLANCEAFIDLLPKKYDTIVGDKGTLLSGGQRQRLALARALFRKPEVLVLDEATNALDSESEIAIQNALAGLAKQITMVVIAHRLGTIQFADNIIVMVDGRISERGTLEELRAKNGQFAAMERLQFGNTRK